MTKEELLQGFEGEVKAVEDWYKAQDASLFSEKGEELWSAAQHLHHLIKSNKPLGNGMGFPYFVLRLKFGKAKAPSRSYDEVVAVYKQALADGGQATGPYVPREIGNEEKAGILGRYRCDAEQFKKNLSKWPDERLDKLRIPHPLIGDMTLREILCFTVYHNGHHRKILEDRFRQS